ncbi:MAG: metallophosphoesterase [Clostridia bacterium]|nr:metallophosphoesterase [Clostridia bacterium]
MNINKNVLRNNHKTFKRALCIILTLFVVFTIVTVWGNVTLSVDTFLFETDKVNVESGYKIAHVSDYHNTDNIFLNDAVFSSLEVEKPDAIVLTGDLIDSRKTDIEIAINFVSRLVEIAPVYYVTGNHECNVSIKSQSAFDNMILDLKALGAVVLRNESLEITLPNNEKLNLFGINDPYFHCEYESEVGEATDSLCASFKVDKSKFNVLLAHHPEQLEIYSEYNFDLVFSGHAHGGQIRIFNQALIAPDQGLFPEFTDGEYKSGDTTLIVSRGIGNSVIPLRLFCRPHLIYLEIK